MPGRRRFGSRAEALATLVALLLLTACGSVSSGQDRGALLAPVAIGDNLLGEACRVERARGDGSQERPEGPAGPTDAEEIYEIRCGAWEQPSAQIVRTTSAAPLPELPASGAWRDRLDEIATCEAPTPARVLGDLPAAELDCVIRRGGWPYRALVVRAGSAIYRADGIPAAEPVMERGIGLLAGQAVAGGPAGGPAGEPVIGATGPLGSAGRATKLYSAGDLASYRQLLHQAQYHNYRGEYPEAEKLYRKALALQQERLPAASGGRAWLLMSLALELSNQERFLEADALFAQADAAMTESFDDADEARLASYRAVHFANQRRGQRAIDLARDASDRRMALANEAGGSIIGAAAGADPAGFVTGGFNPALRRAQPAIAGRGETALGDTVQSRSVEAAMLLRQDRLDEADQALLQAVAALDAEPRLPRRWGPQLRYLQAMVAERRKDLNGAEALLASALPQDGAEAVDGRNDVMVLLALGRVQSAQGRGGAALQSFRRAFAILETRKDGILLEDALPFFDTAMAEAARDPAARPRLHAEMFAAGQLVRSTRTQQSIALASARVSASDRGAGRLIRELQDARRSRDLASEALARARTDPATLAPQLPAQEERVRTLDAAVGDLERQVQAAAPRYHQILDSPTSAEAALRALRPGEALVQILVGPSRSLVFFADTAGIEAYAVDLGERDAERRVALLRAPFDQVAGGAYDVGAAHALFRTLFAPVAGRLAGARHLVVVPSGPLLGLPFGALVEAPPEPVMAGDYSRVAWLAKARAVTLAPSVQAFAGLRDDARASRATKPLIGFGDFVPERDPKATMAALGLPETCRPQVEAMAAMPRLPATAAELEAVRTALRAPAAGLHLRQEFSEATVRAASLRDYRIVYFATHALLPHDFDCWSEPMLIASAAAGDDGLLRASEVAELDLDADLVVLSACNTAAPGGGSGAESLSGLARAFFYAGARSLLVTHWRIPDEPTRTLMTRLFTDLAAENLTTAEALRRAQTALIEAPASSHPLNWAAFSLVGDGGQRLLASPSAAAPIT